MLKLKKLQYSEHKGGPQEWVLKEFELADSNLLVGKNAAGKTRTLNVIGGLTNLLSGRLEPLYDSGHYKVHLSEDKNEIFYELEIENQGVSKEIFALNGEKKISRGETGEGKIYAAKLGDYIDFKVSETQLSVLAKRDEIQHPFLESLKEWADTSFHYKFGAPSAENINNSYTAQVHEMFLKGKNITKNFEETIKEEMRLIGYQIQSIQEGQTPVMLPSPTGMIQASIPGVAVKEKDLRAVTKPESISSGMYRALSLLIQIEFVKLTSSPGLIMIDDIGEGLDFSRTTKLLKILMEETKKASIQLIMSTNDRFIMNVVPLECWSIINRKGLECSVSNYMNSKKEFEDFKFTGLSNFDFFSRDFLSHSEN